MFLGASSPRKGGVLAPSSSPAGSEATSERSSLRSSRRRTPLRPNSRCGSAQTDGLCCARRHAALHSVHRCASAFNLLLRLTPTVLHPGWWRWRSAPKPPPQFGSVAPRKGESWPPHHRRLGAKRPPSEASVFGSEQPRKGGVLAPTPPVGSEAPSERSEQPPERGSPGPIPAPAGSEATSERSECFWEAALCDAGSFLKDPSKTEFPAQGGGDCGEPHSPRLTLLG